MSKPISLSIEEIVSIFRTSNSQKRIEFIESCPPFSKKEEALLAAKLNSEEMRAQTLDFLSEGYTTAGPFDFGAAVGAACYRLAREGYEAGTGDQMSYRMIAGRGALNWMTCLQREGKHSDVIELIQEPIKWLERIDDKDNINSLRLKLIEAECDLENYDNAELHLNMIDESLLQPFVKVSYNALQNRIAQHKGGGTSIPEEHTGPSGQDLMGILKPLQGKSIAERTTNDPLHNDSINYDTYKNGAEKIVNQLFGGAYGAENEFTVRQKIIDANGIFTDTVKGHDPEQIRKIEPVLIAGRDWMKKNNFPDTENDACWGLYLCYSRTKREDLAVIELQRMRANIEAARSKIENPLERAQLSERYPYLHAAECEILDKLGRSEDLLLAIEAGKSRALADLQTIRDHRAADEKQFVNSVRKLPYQMKKLSSHYLTTFVDDDVVYIALITSDGRIHSSRAQLKKKELAEMAAIREPRLWGKKNPNDVFGPKYPDDIPQRLSPLVKIISPLLDTGVMKKGDHLCYSPHDVLFTIPFHYIKLGGSPLVDFFSISRVHGAHSLLEILRLEPCRPESYMAVEVPSVQDLNNQAKLEAFKRAGSWLQEHLSTGKQLSKEKTDISLLASFSSKKLLQNQLIHFSTHGTFPEQHQAVRDPNPFRSSGLVLAAEDKLPNLFAVAKGQANEHILTPEKVLQQDLDFSGSHLTLQACVSGLAKRGYGGDALGLEWAFLQSGAMSILSTHWFTSAQTTSRFVENFYDKWLQKGENRASAWRTAVNELRKKTETSDPYHWAAFSLNGDWR